MTRIARRDGLHEAPRTTFAHQLDTALYSRSGVDPCERPALHTRPDPPNDPGLDPGVDVAPSPERGGHHPCRRVAEMRRRPGSTCSIFKSDRADPGPSPKTMRSPDSKAMGGCGAAEIDRHTDVAHDLHRRGLSRNRPRGCPVGFLQLRSFRPFIHRRAVRAVRHLAESPPCPVYAVQNPRAAAGRHPPPATIASTTAATRRAMAPPCPPHPPALPGPPR